MTTRERPADRGRRLTRRALARVADDLRAARLSAGLSQAAVGVAIGVSHSWVGRLERGASGSASICDVGAYCAVVGLELAVRAYPSGDPLRDRADTTLLDRLRLRLHPNLQWRTEVPIPIPGDLRAWDAVVSGAGWRLGVEAETRIADAQALERRIALKQRDGEMPTVILLVADTGANRAQLAAVRASLRARFPLNTRELLAALRAGSGPRTGGIVIL